MKAWGWPILFYVVAFGVRVLPDCVNQTCFKGLAKLLYSLNTRYKRIVETNLNFAFGDTLSQSEKQAITQKCYVNLMLNILAFIQSFRFKKEDFLERLQFENASVVEKAFKEKRKIIFITAHYGYWEMASLGIAVRFFPVSVVGRPLGVPLLDRILKQSRERFGITMLEKKGAVKGLIAALKDGRGTGILVDQNASPSEGIVIDFFGKKTRHVSTAALLARKFNALIIPVFVESENRKHYTLRFENPIETTKSNDAEKDIYDSVQQQAHITEKAIRKNPAEWLWVHRRWKNQHKELYEKC
jgi:Kdo2-lipid IVA lauroyltransferase/acyltransferase